MQVAVGLVGPGVIGSTLLKQLAGQIAPLRNSLGYDIHVIGLISSRKMKLYNSSCCSLETWPLDLALKGDTPDMDAFMQHMQSAKGCHRIIVDCSASEAVSDRYADWLAAGLHVVTANKKLGSGPLQRYQAAQEQVACRKAQFLYEASVGAGLPVLSTLRTLLDSGDQIQLVEGVLSGTLSYIFNSFGAAKQFSAAVLDAKQQGFTEPDPRDDLSGADVARKVVILARECGLAVSLDDVPVQGLLPAEVAAAPTVEAFLAALPQAFPDSHPFTGLSGSDNIIAFTTARYSKQPLVIRGPGAGAEVTAGGVLGDVVTLARRLSPTAYPRSFHRSCS